MRARSNLWLLRLKKELNEPDDNKAIQELVARFRPGDEQLEVISTILGVGEIAREPLPFDGGVYEIDGKRLIKLNSLVPPVRQAFTLAHEVGHLILERMLGATANCTSDQQLERACDMIAAELLMPTTEAQSLAKRLGDQSPEKLGKIANYFRVSLRTAAQRLFDLGIWKCPMGMWECGPRTRQMWFVGKRPWKTDYPSFSAFELALESKTPVCTTERFAKGPYTELVAVKAHHIGKNYIVAVVATTGK